MQCYYSFIVEVWYLIIFDFSKDGYLEGEGGERFREIIKSIIWIFFGLFSF